MKVFISHQQKDVVVAKMVYETLRCSGVDTYLDLLDSSLMNDGQRLTEHIMSKITESTDVIAVVSENTKESWWVPFEIGVATDKPRPIATYICGPVLLPEYLYFWPQLRTLEDIIKYVKKRRSYTYAAFDNTRMLSESVQIRKDSIAQFYSELNNDIHWR